MLLLMSLCHAMAQIDDSELDDFTVTDNTFNPNRAADSLNASHKKVPKGMHVWTIDERFGDITPQDRDTLQHLVMNNLFTEGRYADYNTTGNLGSPRINRIATDRDYIARDLFMEPYSYFITKPSELRFTNTFSPITNLTYNTCGDKNNGEDHLKVLFASNVNKETGIGFKFNYLYGRGYYQNQSGSYFDYTFWGSHIGPRYQAHLILSFDHMKTTENGGIADDEYITHPEAQSEDYATDEIPTILSSNWNRYDGFHATFSHRYNIGFSKTVPMTEDEINAKRFALQSMKEQEERERKNKDGRQEDTTTPEERPMGRPRDAVIAGDLPSDSTRSIASQMAEMRAKLLADSLAAPKDTAQVDTAWTKEEYVPVTSFIHNMNIDTNHRTYLAYESPSDLYLQTYNTTNDKSGGDSINDVMKSLAIRNRFAIALSEGLNKYVPMGLKIFVAHELRHYSLPALGTNLTDTYNENNISVGGQVIRSESNRLKYNATFESVVAGEDVGNILIDATGTLKMKILGDSANVSLRGFYHLTNPNFMLRHYHSKHFWWDNDDLSKQMHTHVEGSFNISKTHTAVRVAYDNLQNYTYLAATYTRPTVSTIEGYDVNVRQSSTNISLITAMVEQNLVAGPLNWENRVTFQASSDEDALPVPTLNYWTNLYLNFKIARVLSVHFGAEGYYFTEYNAPEYVSQLGQYAVQENADVRTKTGNYPIINVYANFKLRQCRYYLKMSHVTAGSISHTNFHTPHHPINERVLHFGLTWTFFN